jgi:glutamyl-tRNA synthetase
MVRVRFAPSPTGFLHIGAARTAFFNWLFARHKKGQFILRIEDTDVGRSSEDMISGILEGLKWLGLDWDEGPIFQSQRLRMYREKADELLEKGKAYFCYCSQEELQKRKEKSAEVGQYWIYDRHCLHLTQKQQAHFESQGKPKALRFLVPEREISFKDLIHGRISVDSRILEDFVLLRRDGFPTYHLSVVVDDMEQKITQVIRGDDHISNTPKQILLYEAFGCRPPEFAHLALILGSDKKKLSKRHGVTSVLQFREEGFFPLAFLNFLAQMSWSPGQKGNIYPLDEMIRTFSLGKVSKGSPVYDLSKLEWLNGQLISQMEAEGLFPYVKEELRKQDLWNDVLEKEQRARFIKLIDLLKERSRSIRKFGESAKPYLGDDVVYDPEGIEKYLSDERLDSLMPVLIKDFEEIENFTAENIEKTLRSRAEEESVLAALFIHSLRMLVVGEPVSPGIFDVLELVGKKKVLERMGKLENIKRRFLKNE